MTEMAVREHSFGSHSQPETRMERRQQERAERRQRLWRAIGWRASCAMLGATLAGTWSFVGARLEALQAKEPLPACTTLDESMLKPHLGQPTEIARRPSVAIAEALGDHTSLERHKQEVLQAVQPSVVKINVYGSEATDSGGDYGGSGFIVETPGGWSAVLTAGHVVSSERQRGNIAVETTNGHRYAVQSGCYTGKADGPHRPTVPDVAALTLRHQNYTPAPALQFATPDETKAIIQQGQPMYALGFPINSSNNSPAQVTRWPANQPHLNVLLPVAQDGLEGKITVMAGIEKAVDENKPYDPAREDSVLPGMSGGIVVAQVETATGIEVKIVGVTQASNTVVADTDTLKSYGIIANEKETATYKPRLTYLGSVSEMMGPLTAMDKQQPLWRAVTFAADIVQPS